MVTWEALDALSHVFELSGIRPESSVVALVDDDPLLGPLIRAALARSRSDAIEIRSVVADASPWDQMLTSRLFSAAITEADIVVDAITPTTGTPIGTPTGGRAGQAWSAQIGPGTRVLRLGAGATDAHRRPAHVTLRARVARTAQLLNDGFALRLSDDHGTALTIELPGSVVDTDHGWCSDDHPVATFPSGWVALTPTARRVNGDLIIMPGDANLNRRAHISSPVRITISDDYITQIDGDNADADVLRAQLEYCNDADAYGVAGLSLGLNPGSQRTTSRFDSVLASPPLAKLSAGVVCLGFGNNPHAERPSADTVSLALGGRSLVIDDLVAVEKGVLVGDLAPDVYEVPG